MATRFYLHRAEKSLGSGTLPSAEQSALAAAVSQIAQTSNLDMDTAISTVAQTSVSTSIAITTTSQNVYVGKWVSNFLDVTSIAANTWTLNFAAQGSSSFNYYPTDGANKIFCNIYVWRPSTGAIVGTIVDNVASTNSANDLRTAEGSVHVTFTGAAVTCQASDVLIVEIWLKPKGVSAGTYACIFYYDGTTVTATDDTTVSNHAAFLETPQNITFYTPPVDATITNTKTQADKFITKV